MKSRSANNPLVMAFLEDAAWPASVCAPVEDWALMVLDAICAADDMMFPCSSGGAERSPGPSVERVSRVPGVVEGRVVAGDGDRG